MRFAALLVAVVTIVIGIIGIASPDLLTMIRRQYFATPVGLYGAAAVRVVMGVIVILAAPNARAPKTLRALGALMCLQALVAALAGPDRAREILEWEARQGAGVLRIGAAGALAAGSFLAVAVTSRHSSSA